MRDEIRPARQRIAGKSTEVSIILFSSRIRIYRIEILRIGERWRLQVAEQAPCHTAKRDRKIASTRRCHFVHPVGKTAEIGDAASSRKIEGNIEAKAGSRSGIAAEIRVNKLGTLAGRARHPGKCAG